MGRFLRWLSPSSCILHKDRAEEASRKQREVVTRLSSAALDDIESSNQVIRLFGIRDAATAALSRLEKKNDHG